MSSAPRRTRAGLLVLALLCATESAQAFFCFNFSFGSGGGARNSHRTLPPVLASPVPPYPVLLPGQPYYPVYPPPPGYVQYGASATAPDTE